MAYKTTEPRSNDMAYFSDGYRHIDFVLAYQPDSGFKKRAQMVRFRQKFEAAMRKEGLELEVEGKENSQDGKTTFVKVHATWEALTRQAELERLQMPILESDIKAVNTSWTTRLLTAIFGTNPFSLQPEYHLNKTEYFTDAYERSREHQFLIDDQDTFFTPAQRVYLTWSIMSGITVSLNIQKKSKRSKGGAKTNTSDDMGWESNMGGSTFDDVQLDNGELDQEESRVKAAKITNLLKQHVYTDAFPLHDCDPDEDDGVDWHNIPVNKWPKRRYLRKVWGNFGQWRRYQPLDEIRDYFGEKVAMYFAWLGFYTKMLILPSIVGVIVFLVGIVHSFYSQGADIFCNAAHTDNQLLCRGCNKPFCPYINIAHECSNARVAAVIDNSGATLFAIFMAVWAVVFLERWKRYQAELRVRWDVSEGELAQEQVRPEYVLNVGSVKLNPVTQKTEPYLSKRSVLKRLVGSVATVVFFLLVVVALISTVMVYKMAGPILWFPIVASRTADSEVNVSISPTMLTSITASILNGVFIGIMGFIYTKVAWKLTELELPRTEEAFEQSYTYKVFIFQFVNFYGSLFFLSFGRNLLMGGLPHETHFYGGCPPTGCLIDVSIQLFVIFTGKQAINNILELGMPALTNWCKKRKSEQASSSYTRWEKDFDLNAPPPLGNFGDYLEMLIQFGFITMFVPAFPLAPLFALLNNIIELRLDAYNVLIQTRRRIPMRVKDIGPWEGILTVMSRIAVITNAFLIAFTTHYVDRFVFFGYRQSTDSSITNFDFFMKPFDTMLWCDRYNTSSSWVADLSAPLSDSAYCDLMRTVQHQTNGTLVNVAVEQCYVHSYRDPNNDFKPTTYSYVITLSKLAFVICFEHLVLIIQAFLAYLIPDVPDHVTVRQQREVFLQRQAFKEHELGEVDQKLDTIEVSDEEFTADDSIGKWDLSSFTSSLPTEVALHQLGPQPPKRPPVPRRSLYALLIRKLMVCGD